MSLVHTITCPACWSTMPIIIEVEWGSQAFIEDCSVCCRPMEIAVEVQEGQVVSVTVEAS